MISGKTTRRRYIYKHLMPELPLLRKQTKLKVLKTYTWIKKATEEKLPSVKVKQGGGGGIMPSNLASAS